MTSHPTLTIARPDDFHLHLRQGDVLPFSTPHTAKKFARAIIMPNLDPPVCTVAQALAYRTEILAALQQSPNADEQPFQPLMTLYLTDQTPIEQVRLAGESPHIFGFKLYPRGATTGSSHGVLHPLKLHRLYQAMAENHIVLQIHGEQLDPDIDVFDREKVFIDRVLREISQEHPTLKIVFEHITTKEGAQFVEENQPQMMATITPHHLWYNRNAMFPDGRINPHHYCLPILKREHHRQALIQAATSGQACYAAGTDSAPHERDQKESACGCAGIFNAPCALETYVEIFENVQALDKLEGFLAHHGAQFYDLPVNEGSISLVKQPWQMPESITDNQRSYIPFRAGDPIAWSVTKANKNPKKSA